jgi:hypothetical protein
MKSRRSVLPAAILAFGLASFLYAHGGHPHAMGTVTAVEAKRVEIKTAEGKLMSIRLTDQTKYFRDGSAVDRDLVRVGTRIVVDLSRNGEELVADEVRVGTSPKSVETKKP